MLPNSVNHMNIADLAETLHSQKPKKYNCAQAVAKAFNRDDLVEPLAICGGGQAPDGLCGALYAAMLILPESRQEVMKQCFHQAAGDIQCRPIRQTGNTSCTQCVRIAAEIAERLSEKD